MKNVLLISCLICCLVSCKKEDSSQVPLLNENNFLSTVDGKEVALYTLESGNGLYMQVTNFGGRVVSLFTPDKKGKHEDVVLGYENLDRYLNNEGERFLGPVVGRYANRIGKGKFTLDSIDYQLPLNNNGQSLHGGMKGLDMVVWNVDKVTDHEIQLSYVSPDGEEGYPGTLSIRMIYELTPDNEFRITYHATTDKPTVVNLSHHGLFNLKGEGNGTITDHILMLNASHITPVDDALIPTGEITPVEGTPFDFRVPTAIGKRIDAEDPQLKNGAGYDHNWVIDRKTEKEIELVAKLYEPQSGRVMEVWTDQPGIQFYSGNFFDGKVKGKYGKTQNYREAVALETQKFPDSPNQPHFPSTRLNPGEEYTQTCIYKFYTE
ncbi:MAG: galactose mutarotase [Candidatus Azobacteroides sp.]|nr:galactose mutarotase [Candidatus Azobacteroides sp.]